MVFLTRQETRSLRIKWTQKRTLSSVKTPREGNDLASDDNRRSAATMHEQPCIYMHSWPWPKRSSHGGRMTAAHASIHPSIHQTHPESSFTTIAQPLATSPIPSLHSHVLPRAHRLPVFPSFHVRGVAPPACVRRDTPARTALVEKQTASFRRGVAKRSGRDALARRLDVAAGRCSLGRPARESLGSESWGRVCAWLAGSFTRRKRPGCGDAMVGWAGKCRIVGGAITLRFCRGLHRPSACSSGCEPACKLLSMSLQPQVLRRPAGPAR